MKRPACVPLSRVFAIGTRTLPDATLQGETQPEKGPAGPQLSETRAHVGAFDLRGAFCHRHISARHRRRAWWSVLGGRCSEARPRRSVLEAPNAEFAIQGTIITACFVVVWLGTTDLWPFTRSGGGKPPWYAGLRVFLIWTLISARCWPLRWLGGVAGPQAASA